MHQPVMADIGGFRQAGGAGGVDQQRAVGDGDAAPLGVGQRSPDEFVRSRDRCGQNRRLAVRPDFRPARKLRRRRFARVRAQFGVDDDVLRAPRCRCNGPATAPRKIGVDQRDDAADAGDAEPDRHIFRPVRHHQADGFAFGESLRRAPSARSGWRARRARDRSASRGWPRSAPARRRESAPARRSTRGRSALRIGGDRRGRFQRAQPIAQRAVLAAAVRLSAGPVSMRVMRGWSRQQSEFSASTLAKFEHAGHRRSASKPLRLFLRIRRY